MKHNVPDPIVPVLNECCSACFYAVLYQDMVKLKKAELLPCRNCYRFLYYDEEEQQDTQQASY
jgi:predicted  nucleic acid-binding Zn-ribbon protein